MQEFPTLINPAAQETQLVGLSSQVAQEVLHLAQNPAKANSSAAHFSTQTPAELNPLAQAVQAVADPTQVIQEELHFSHEVPVKKNPSKQLLVHFPSTTAAGQLDKHFLL